MITHRTAAPDHDRRRSRSIGANVFRTGVAIACAFTVLALGAGWWQVVDAQRLSTAPDNPAVIALARRALRGPIVDRNGLWLARSERDANGEALRLYRDDTISHVVGYASRRYGTAGLERTYNAELLGPVRVGRLRAGVRQVRPGSRRIRSGSSCRSTCGCSAPPCAGSGRTRARS